MSKAINPNKIVIFSGAGISAESGIPTFRDSDGLWHNHTISDVATPMGWEKDPALVLDFYNQRRQNVFSAEPNEAHQAIARLQEKFEVIVITQNIDNLHERGGAHQVIHLHGEITKARSTADENLVYELGEQAIQLGDHCEKGSQLRPHIVWFGEEILHYDTAREHMQTAAKVLVVGTSLMVFPAASLLKKTRFHAEKLIVGLDIEKVPYGYRFIRAKASKLVPFIVDCWLSGRPLE